ncbi:hypothetical protein PZA11_002445 [Diplocarpon coronariae]
MGNPLSAYAGSVLFSFVGVLAFVTCVLGGMWLHRLYTTRGFHLSEFAALRSQAARLVQETASVWQDVARDSSTDLSVKILHMARVEAADDVDCEIRAALNAWEDIMQPGEGDALALDEEDGVGGGKLDRRGEKRMRAKRKSHGRYVIGLMREKCRAAIERRRDLSQGLQIMQLEVLSRRVEEQSSCISRRLASGSQQTTPRITIVGSHPPRLTATSPPCPECRSVWRRRQPERLPLAVARAACGAQSTTFLCVSVPPPRTRLTTLPRTGRQTRRIAAVCCLADGPRARARAAAEVCELPGSGR